MSVASAISEAVRLPCSRTARYAPISYSPKSNRSPRRERSPDSSVDAADDGFIPHDEVLVEPAAVDLEGPRLRDAVHRMGCGQIVFEDIFGVTNPELFDTWESVAAGLSLTTLDSLDVGRIRGIGSAGYGVMHVHPEASLNDPNAYKFGDRDLYVTESESSDSVVAKHRHTGDTFTIPRDDLVPNLRRYTGRTKADLSDIPEYAILNDGWDGGDRYMQFTDEPTIPDKWSDRVRSRMGHIALVRRVNITAIGTHHLAYYSEDRRLYPDMMWVLPDANKEEAKLLTAWFDSTFGWLQSLFDRIETEGGWIEWHGYIVDKYRVPRPSALGEDDRVRKQLIETFDAVKGAEAPSLVKQLALNAKEEYLTDEELDRIDEALDMTDAIGDEFEPRRKLDKGILTAANISEDEHEDFLDKFYSDIVIEIVALKLMMES